MTTRSIFGDGKGLSDKEAQFLRENPEMIDFPRFPASRRMRHLPPGH